MDPGIIEVLKEIARENIALALALGALYYVMKQWVIRERMMAEEYKGDKEILITTLNANTEALTKLTLMLKAIESTQRKNPTEDKEGS